MKHVFTCDKYSLKFTTDCCWQMMINPDQSVLPSCSEIVETELKYGKDLRIIVDEFYHPMLGTWPNTWPRISSCTWPNIWPTLAQRKSTFRDNP